VPSGYLSPVHGVGTKPRRAAQLLSRQEPEPAFPRIPHRLHFRSPAGPGHWRITGRINWPCLTKRYEAPPTCEWTNDEGDKIWLPAQYARIVADLEGMGEPDFVERAGRPSYFFLKLIPRSWKTFLNPSYVTLCYLHLAADVGF
jgi:hypothetical protein